MEVLMDNNEINKKLNNINGWFHPIDVTCFDIFLSNIENKPGDLCEFGVWEGKSLSKLIQYSNNNLVYAVDHIINEKGSIIIDNVKKLFPDYNLNNLNLLNINTSIIDSFNYSTYFKNKFKFLHLDSAHQSTYCYQELQLIHYVMQSDGLIVVDDIFDKVYPGKTEALFKFLHEQADIILFLISDRKAYLCDRKSYDYYTSLMPNIITAVKELNNNYNVIKVLHTFYKDFYSIVPYGVSTYPNNISYCTL